MEAEHALQTVSRIVCCRAHHHLRDCGVNASSPSHHIAQRELVLANEAIINMAAKLLEVIIAKIPTSISTCEPARRLNRTAQPRYGGHESVTKEGT